MSPRDLSLVRRLADEAIGAGDPLGWFEPLYLAAARGEAVIPWADRGPNPSLLRWTADHGVVGDGRRALVVGCGGGDDAEALAALGFSVVAFDLSAAAIRLCQSRFPDTHVDYAVADLLAPPGEWTESFDFVFEANTIQALPVGRLRTGAIAALATFVAPGGELLVVARGRDEDEPLDQVPWPLTRAEVDACGGDALEPAAFEDFLDDEDPPVRRFLAVFRRSSS